ncbi:MAG: capsule biosynthesis protein [Gammaproteobacteria bacterium]|nr:capsule biosynthesis protein [Gammaproteobacteria bacterium]
MKILFFSPHAGIWAHAFPEALIAESLKQRGHEIVYVTCEQSFEEFCTVMTAYGLTNSADSEKKQSVCQTCNQYKKIITDKFEFRNYSLKDHLDNSDYREIEMHLQAVNQENFSDFSLEGIEIGRLTLYQMLLEYKKNSLNFTPEEWERCLIDLKNTLVTYYAAKKILLQEKPDALVVYNSLYSVNHLLCKLAHKNKIMQYFLHAGGNLATRLETMILGENDGFQYYRHLLARWHDFKHVPCQEKLISKVNAHLLSVIQGATVFSYSQGVGIGQVDIHRFFGIKPSQKIILATMSSNDERFAASIVRAYNQSDSVLFATQFDWLKAIIEYVKHRSELFLIIRVHPREFPNRRDSVISQNYNQIQEVFSQLPSNVKINWPEDKISLYHLAQETDLCLNSWSSAGKELAALGIPVLLYSEELQVYPPDLNYVGETLCDYFSLFEQALRDGWDFERARKAYRWYAFEYFRTTLDISDSYKVKTQTFPRKVYQKCMRMVDTVALQKADCRQRAKNLASGGIINEIISNKKRSILDVLDANMLESTSFENETDYLKKYLNIVFKTLEINNTKKSLLLHNFQKYLTLSEKQHA